jgi:hypothetical protein
METLQYILKKSLSRQLFPYWLVVIALLFTVHGFSWDDIYINRTKEHYKCLFPDGSYTESKETYKWLFYAEIFPHAQSRTGGSTERKYVNSSGKSFSQTANDNSYCEGVGKKDGRLISRDAFEDGQGKLVKLSDDVMPGIPSWRSLPRTIPTSLDQNAEVREFTKREFLYAGARWHISVLSPNAKHLLAEQPLTALDHPTVLFNTVLYVYQTESNDFGATWTQPVITKEAKLFEMGKTLMNQSWAPKLKWITGDTPPS